MKTMFAFPEMFKPHIEGSRLKLADNLRDFDREEYPHLAIFLALNLGVSIDIEDIGHNANVVADVPLNRIYEVTFEELINMGYRQEYGGDWA